jgi:hypothetical protein
MKVSILKIPPIVALALSATTSAYAAMLVAPPVAADSSIVRVDCDYGWYRGPDGRCYIAGTGPRYYRGRGNYERGYYRHRDWHRGDEYGGDQYRPQYPLPYPFNGPQYDQY